MFYLGAFKKIASAAALAGLLSGLLLTGLQQIHVAPAILKAESFEQAATSGSLTAEKGMHATAVDEHDHDDHDHEAHDHDHGSEWAPQNGAERTAFTALANVSVAVGFALILGAGMFLRGGRITWQTGLLWGAAGYLVFFIAPSIGLPPELPGTESAPLIARQQWWLLTVAATAGGLALSVFARNRVLKIIGVVLLIVPHLLGAPQPVVHGSAAPIELTRSFIYATAIANAVFWATLGALLGFFYKRME